MEEKNAQVASVQIGQEAHSSIEIGENKDGWTCKSIKVYGEDMHENWRKIMLAHEGFEAFKAGKLASFMAGAEAAK